jgi:hypothetical protein
MTKWLLVVETNCNDPTRENEFKEWYDKIHIPDVLETQGFVKATRYEITQPIQGKGKFLAIYEIESDQFDNVMKLHEQNMKKKREQGRITSLITRVSRAIYRQAS